MTQEGEFPLVRGPIGQQPEPNDSKRGVPVDRTYRRSDLFPVMWGVAHLAHVALHGGGAFTVGTQLVVFGTAVALLLRPRSTALLLALALSQLVDWLSAAPFNPDHWTLVAAVNLTLLLMATISRSRRDQLVDATAGSLQILLLIAYGAAAFAKWNWTFLSPATSCAAWIADRASFGLLDGVPGSGPVAVAVALGSESLVFLLLLAPRTRPYGARLGLLFHAVVSLSPAMAVSDFTATVFALFVLFLSDKEIDVALRRLEAMTTDSPVIAMFRRHRWIVPAWLVICGGVAGFISQSLSLLLVWVTFTTYAVVTLVATVPMAGRATRPARLRASLAVIPAGAFLIFTALNPYLGLRTTGAFTMFSNLRTEGEGSNHLFAAGWHVAAYQNELLVLTGSSDEDLRALAEDSQALTLASMRLMPRLVSDVTVTGTVDGADIHWTDQNSAAVIGAPSRLERWLLSFRPVALDGVPRCGN